MAKKSKATTKTKTWREKYFERRKSYEKKLIEMEKEGWYYINPKTGEYLKPIDILPKIPKRPTSPSIKAMEKIFRSRYNVLYQTRKQPDKTEYEVISGRKFLQEQRYKAAAKGAATRAKNKLFEQQRKKDIIEYEKAKQEKSFDDIIEELNKRLEDEKEQIYKEESEEEIENEYLEQEPSYDETVRDYTDEEIEETDYDIPDEFDDEAWRQRKNQKSEEETENENIEEAELILHSALDDLENWIGPFYYSPAMYKTQSSRIINAIDMIIQNLDKDKIKDIANRLIANADTFNHAIEILLTNYEEDLNMAALDDIFFTLMGEGSVVSLEDNARINSYTESVVGW